MSTEMKNPYDEHGAHLDEIKFSHRLGWVFVIVFLALITLPPLVRNLSEAFNLDPAEPKWIAPVKLFDFPSSEAEDLFLKKKSNSSRITRTSPSLRDHLQAFEKGAEEADFAGISRRVLQQELTGFLGEGNQKVILGKDGWLFYRAAFDGLTGYGPLNAEPDAVTKDPDRAEWYQPLPVIRRFAKQLEERGIELILVPVPVKPMIYPEEISGKEVAELPLRHPDQLKFYEALEEAGVRVIDLSDSFVKLKEAGEQVFLKQDTHWTAATMQAAAKEVAAYVKGRPWFGELQPDLNPTVQTAGRENLGDLVGMLDLPEPRRLYEPETQTIEMISADGGAAVTSSASKSPLVVLGDSFVNVYDDPGLGFAPENSGSEEESRSSIGAGFAQHLAKELSLELETHVANGGGATAVRQSFAKRPDNRVREKKAVIWVLASRDLLLSETPGGKASVQWRDVTFSDRIEEDKPEQTLNAPAGTITLTGTVLERSSIPDPKSTPYEDALYSAQIKVGTVEAGKFGETEPLLYLWAFKKRTLQPTANLEAGKTYRFTLVPWSSKTELHTLTKQDDLTVFTDPWFVEKMEEVK